MKIAAKMSVTALLTVMGAGVLLPATAEAQGANTQGSPIIIDGATTPQATKSPVIPAPGPAGAVSGSEGAKTPSANDAVSVKQVLDSIRVPSATSAIPHKDNIEKDHITKESKDAKKTSGNKENESEEEEDDRSGFPSVKSTVPSSVKGVVNRLNNATQDVTLDDLNSAREAIVKLDVLIDIEKRLSDLAEIRKEREQKVDLLEGAIPASALGARSVSIAPPALASSTSSAILPVVTSPVPVTPVMPMSSSVDVVRVFGTNGEYTAQIKEVDGASTRARAGDKLKDGSTITSISRNGVTLVTSDKKTKTIQVKDVTKIFSGRQDR